MAKEITTVTIATNEINTVSQIMRAALSGANACMKLHDRCHMEQFMLLFNWAQSMHRNLINKHVI